MMTGLKMQRKTRGFCVALLLAATSVYAARRSLNSISDLISCHQAECTNIFELLHWFASEVDIDRDNVIRLTFNPNSGAYGSHYYRNQEGLLDPLPRGYQYYTIGNIHQAGSRRLPSYVVHSQRRNILWNSARILIRVTEGGQIIDQVYITRHYDTSENHGSSYDPNHTYRVTPNFLRQLRKFSINEIQRAADGSQTTPFRNTSVAPTQEVYYAKQDTHIDMPDNPPNQDDCLGNCVSIFCSLLCLVFVFLVILGSYLGNWRK